ncbi:MAG: CCA tRNA nucleotidyltransferase [Magnetococcales bacterium]|nr:CCA tRNA nucleotidyltransferase [Magnetococcales bacterium]MBF0437734.1 CCA tRNA nucleotidyltransferase [Magnetococcales bacterium]
MIPSFPNAFAPFIRNLLDDINRLIGPIYLVGEAPLCGIQGRPLPNTLDILVAHPLAECRKRLHRGDHPEAIMGQKHNSLLLPIKEWMHPKVLDIASFKSRPNHPATVEEDLLHRDITINAMAYTWPNGPLIDPFGGRQDLLTGEIRLVNGIETLQQNPLRALVFFRFAMQLNRPPNPDDLHLVEQTSLASTLPEQIRIEMDRILSLPLANEESQNQLRELFASPLGNQILPHLSSLHSMELQPGSEDPWKQMLDTTLAITAPSDGEEISLLDLRWVTLLGGIGLLKNCSIDHMESNLAQINKRLEYYQFSRRRSRRILALLRNLSSTTTPTDRQLKRYLQDHIPLEGVFRLLQAVTAANPNITEADRINEELKFQEIRNRCRALRQVEKRLRPIDLVLSGGEILDIIRKKPGPWLRDLQASLVDLVSQDPSRNNKAELQNQVQKWIKKQREI